MILCFFPQQKSLDDQRRKVQEKWPRSGTWMLAPSLAGCVLRGKSVWSVWVSFSLFKKWMNVWESVRSKPVWMCSQKLYHAMGLRSFPFSLTLSYSWTCEPAFSSSCFLQPRVLAGMCWRYVLWVWVFAGLSLSRYLSVQAMPYRVNHNYMHAYMNEWTYHIDETQYFVNILWRT